MDDKLRTDYVSQALNLFNNLSYDEQVELFKTLQKELVSIRSCKAESLFAEADKMREMAKAINEGSSHIDGLPQTALKPSYSV